MKEVYTQERIRINQNRYEHITKREREIISKHLSAGKRISYIAKALNRSKSSISEEIRRGWYKGKYNPSIANDRSLAARKKSHEHTKWRNTDLQHFILQLLKEKWSPEIIAHAWNEQHHDYTISHTFIYDLIENHRREWVKYLIYKGRHRRKLTHLAGRDYIKNRTDISLRPEIVNKRERFGDFEVDTVISSKGGKSCIAVAVERKSRYYILRKIPDKSATSMNNALMDIFKNITVKTITYDNGSENMKHDELNKLLGCKSYFCRPYCSADKGSIENRNKILRQFLPKKTNFDLISQHQLDIIQNKINNRPMKILNWNTPSCLFLTS
jgi:IS30 family transposase